MPVGEPHRTVAQRENRTAFGVAMMALAVLFFTCIDTSAKWLVTAGIAAIQVVFVRYAVHFLLALVLFLPREGRAAIRSNAPGRQFLRSTFLFGSTICNFTALQFLPITVTTTIMFAGPIAVTLLAIPILNERVGLHRLAAVCVGFAGVLVVMQPWGTGFHPAMLLNLVAMVVASLYFIMTRMLAGIESNATSQIWASGLATFCLGPFAIRVWQWPDAGVDWAPFLLIGAFGGVGHIFATHAHRMADASILAPIVYIQIVLAAAASIIVFNVYPTVWTLGGGLIIAGAGLYIWWRERRR
ncbi:Permease of the drug/metabolite transporter (DMT) superfamily [Roseovarius azorensis]|uniref:Permease of the drug/metabolite transporter (DMT) superfamily n=1 Tax=Roseovarius azorensis TaxID=1287727 RepID=A0A1H7V0B0_9RHOB|nr:DMT family transporter [Roseovarius azorensis]SEM02197.1 Permease of the drug/metabolite transporter (DMT) superfamily [Roseovarius azorensis]